MDLLAWRHYPRCIAQGARACLYSWKSMQAVRTSPRNDKAVRRGCDPPRLLSRAGSRGMCQQHINGVPADAHVVDGHIPSAMTSPVSVCRCGCELAARAAVIFARVPKSLARARCRLTGNACRGRAAVELRLPLPKPCMGGKTTRVTRRPTTCDRRRASDGALMDGRSLRAHRADRCGLLEPLRGCGAPANAGQDTCAEAWRPTHQCLCWIAREGRT